MRLNRLHVVLTVLVFSLLLASPAFANTVTLTYEGHGAGNNTSYPWLFSINGSGQPYTTLICDAYDNYNYVGRAGRRRPRRCCRPSAYLARVRLSITKLLD